MAPHQSHEVENKTNKKFEFESDESNSWLFVFNWDYFPSCVLIQSHQLSQIPCLITTSPAFLKHSSIWFIIKEYEVYDELSLFYILWWMEIKAVKQHISKRQVSIH